MAVTAAAVQAEVEAEVVAAAEAAHTGLVSSAGRKRENRSVRDWPPGCGRGMVVAAAPGEVAALAEEHREMSMDRPLAQAAAAAAAAHTLGRCTPVGAAAAGRNCLEMDKDPAVMAGGLDTMVRVAAEVEDGPSTTRCDGGSVRLG